MPLTHAHASCLTLAVSPAMLAGRICVGFRNADALCTLPGMRMRERLLSFPSRVPHGGSCSASTRLYVSDDRTSAFRAYHRICKRGVHSGRLLLAKCALSWPAETCLGTVGGLSDQCGPCVLKVVTFACRSDAVPSILICRGQVNALEFQPKITHQSAQMKMAPEPSQSLTTSVDFCGLSTKTLAGLGKRVKRSTRGL